MDPCLAYNANGKPQSEGSHAEACSHLLSGTETLAPPLCQGLPVVLKQAASNLQ